jgi:sporadic carbohydrate cluster protein (TIGR04323 family)
MTSQRSGFRGYIGSRTYSGSRVPQHVQNLVIRDYCARRGMDYLLSATEYAMPNSYMMLEQVLEECKRIRGAVLYSLFMLPEDRKLRLSAYDRVLESGAELHAAVESLALRTGADIGPLEDIWLVHQLLPKCPQTLRISAS